MKKITEAFLQFKQSKAWQPVKDVLMFAFLLLSFHFIYIFLGKSQFLSFQDSGGSAFHLCFRHSFQSKCLDFAAYFWPRCNDGKSNYIRDKSSRDLELCRCKPRLYKLKAVDALDFYHGLFSRAYKT